MRSAKKWKKDLESVGFAKHSLYSDEDIFKLIYKDDIRRYDLLKWLAYRIGDDDSVFGMPERDLAKYFCDHFVLDKRSAEDFIYARCSQKEQENNWKVLFSFTRMKNFLSSAKNNDHIDNLDKTKSIKPKKCTIRGNEIHENHQKQPSPDATGDGGTENKSLTLVQKDYSNRGDKPLLYTPNIDSFINETHLNSEDSLTSGSQRNPFVGQELPRLFIPKGAPPLGGLDEDCTNYKIVFEKDASMNIVEPLLDECDWYCRTFLYKK